MLTDDPKFDEAAKALRTQLVQWYENDQKEFPAEELGTFEEYVQAQSESIINIILKA